jgi:hypothetical protein
VFQVHRQIGAIGPERRDNGFAASRGSWNRRPLRPAMSGPAGNSTSAVGLTPRNRPLSPRSICMAARAAV